MEPLKRSYVTKPISSELIATAAAKLGVSPDEARAQIEKHRDACETWVNEIYQVTKTVSADESMAQINIRRRDGKPIFRDWRHFQAIKNQLCGAECEGVEIYPAESRLVDTSNKYHLWVILDPAYRFPFGWPARDVSFVKSTVPGLRQRPQS